MNVTDWINILSVTVLIGFIIALVFLIVLLYRANKAMARIDHLSDTFRKFVEDIVPAMVNIGTITTAIHGVLRAFADHTKAKNEKK